MKSIKEKNKRIAPLVSLCILVSSFLLIRYSMFELHGMIEWPLVLAIVCLAVIIVSFFRKAVITPLLTSASYITGFFLAYIFQSNGTDSGGARTNNIWIIWTVIIIVTIIFSSVYEFVRLRKIVR